MTLILHKGLFGSYVATPYGRLKYDEVIAIKIIDPSQRNLGSLRWCTL